MGMSIDGFEINIRMDGVRLCYDGYETEIRTDGLHEYETFIRTYEKGWIRNSSSYR